MSRNVTLTPAEPPSASRLLHSFDGGVVLQQRLARPEKYRDLEILAGNGPTIARGGGYSYAPASLGKDVLVQEMRAFDRILDFDSSSGIIECEAGISLEKLYRFLTPRGWCVAVQPGYPRISLGGCIAADVHGKNQYLDGTFSRSLISVRLFHPAHGILEASRERNQEPFALTCGGLGLTGHILSARLQLQKLSGSGVRIVATRIRSLAETPGMLQKLAGSTPLLYSWHNLSVAGSSFGRGFLYGAEFRGGSASPDSMSPRTRSIDSESRDRLRLQWLNRFTIPWFNRIYELQQSVSPRTRDVELFDFLFPVAKKMLFFELFGRAGFHEVQMILPGEAFSEASEQIRGYLERERVGVCLASCKLFRGRQSLLRFDGTGVCLALDFPRDSRSEKFAAFLDELVVRLKGLPNVIKDSRLPRAVVEACYPEYDLFRDRLRVFDPKRFYRSELSERLRL